MPEALIAPRPAWSQALGFCDRRSCPPKKTVLVFAATEYSESHPVALVHLWLTVFCVAGNAAVTSQMPWSGNLPFQL
jgi:hypothetical protein